MKRRSELSASHWRRNLAYFTDRDLAKKFPTRLRDSGITLITHAEVLDQDASDREWIRWACSRGYICLTHDRGISRQDARDEVIKPWNPPGALFIIRGSASNEQLADRFLSVQARVESMVVRQRRRGLHTLATVREKTERGGRKRIVVESLGDRKRRRRHT